MPLSKDIAKQNNRKMWVSALRGAVVLTLLLLISLGDKIGLWLFMNKTQSLKIGFKESQNHLSVIRPLQPE